MTALHDHPTAVTTVESAGRALSRYGLVLVIVWLGAMKFTAYEAEGIEPLVASSPLMSWLYGIFSIYTFSALLGAFELAVAALLAVRPWWPRLSALGSLGSIALFLATLSFMFSAPEVFASSAGGFPLLGMTGAFLIKDVVLLGVSVWTLGDALTSR